MFCSASSSFLSREFVLRRFGIPTLRGSSLGCVIADLRVQPVRFVSLVNITILACVCVWLSHAFMLFARIRASALSSLLASLWKLAQLELAESARMSFTVLWGVGSNSTRDDWCQCHQEVHQALLEKKVRSFDRPPKALEPAR